MDKTKDSNFFIQYSVNQAVIANKQFTDISHSNFRNHSSPGMELGKG